MKWLILHTEQNDRQIANIYSDIGQAVKMLMWLKQVRLPRHIVYGVDEVNNY